MTNEELALKVQSGNSESAEQLWDQVRPLTFQFAGRFYGKSRGRCGRRGVTLEDLQQECFLAVMDAAQAYDPESGFKFTAFLHFPLKNHFNALIGCRGHQKKNPLDESASLDELIPGTDDPNMILGNAVPDPGAELPFEKVEDTLFSSQLHTVLDRCLDTLPVEQREVVIAKYYSDLTLNQIADNKGQFPEQIKILERKGLQGLRKPLPMSWLKRFSGYIASKAYCGTGYLSFKYGGASVEERIAEYIEDRENWKQVDTSE